MCNFHCETQSIDKNHGTGYQHHGVEYWLNDTVSNANCKVKECSGDEDTSFATQQLSLTIDQIRTPGDGRAFLCQYAEGLHLSLTLFE